jgi:hypothetical protein
MRENTNPNPLEACRYGVGHACSRSPAPLMPSLIGAMLLFFPAAVAAQAMPTGKWDVTSTAVDLDIPGAPSFLLRMMKGRSKSEHKCLSPGQAGSGVAALLTPDPKAQGEVDSLQLESGHYRQTLTCPQKSGSPIRINRSGTYDASGFAGRLDMIGQTPKGAMHIILDQKATHVAGICRG